MFSGEYQKRARSATGGLVPCNTVFASGVSPLLRALGMETQVNEFVEVVQSPRTTVSPSLDPMARSWIALNRRPASE